MVLHPKQTLKHFSNIKRTLRTMQNVQKIWVKYKAFLLYCLYSNTTPSQWVASQNYIYMKLITFCLFLLIGIVNVILVLLVTYLI